MEKNAIYHMWTDEDGNSHAAIFDRITTLECYAIDGIKGAYTVSESIDSGFCFMHIRVPYNVSVASANYGRYHGLYVFTTVAEDETANDWIMAKYWDEYDHDENEEKPTIDGYTVLFNRFGLEY